MRKQYFVKMTVIDVQDCDRMDGECVERWTAYDIRYLSDICPSCQGTDAQRFVFGPTQVRDTVDLDGFSLGIAKLITSYLPPQCRCHGSGHIEIYEATNQDDVGPKWKCKRIISHGVQSNESCVILGTYPTVFEKELRELYDREQELRRLEEEGEIERLRRGIDNAIHRACGYPRSSKNYLDTTREEAKYLECLIEQKQALEEDLLVKRTELSAAKRILIQKDIIPEHVRRTQCHGVKKAERKKVDNRTQEEEKVDFDPTLKNPAPTGI